MPRNLDQRLAALEAQALVGDILTIRVTYADHPDNDHRPGPMAHPPTVTSYPRRGKYPPYRVLWYDNEPDLAPAMGATYGHR